MNEGIRDVMKADGKALLRRALRLTRQHADAWDLLQDTFERALTHAPARCSDASASRWLVVVMQNLNIDRLRRASRYPEVMMTDAMLATDPEVTSKHPDWRTVESSQIASCLGRLDARLREAYTLNVEQGLPLATVAARLGVPLATVGTRVYRARQRLRKLLGERSGADGIEGTLCA